MAEMNDLSWQKLYTKKAGCAVLREHDGLCYRMQDQDLHLVLGDNGLQRNRSDTSDKHDTVAMRQDGGEGKRPKYDPSHFSMHIKDI